tara:strand:- start:4075 stop:5493 length:1419 start_codon:yes stop_codon:yes gene_type:complete
MAIVINTQPTSNKLCSTLVPLKFIVTETTADTTNIVATCYIYDQTTAVETQISGKFRMAPSLSQVDTFLFDSSEIFNTLTKYTLKDYPNNIQLGTNEGSLLTQKIWQDVATYYVAVKFQREYLDAATGLIVLEAATINSNRFYVHEGVPEKRWLNDMVNSNGSSASVFDYFNFYFDTDKQYKRYFTNYPIIKRNQTTSLRTSNVKIHKSESYMLMFVAPIDTRLCNDYKIYIKTYSDDFLTFLNIHAIDVSDSPNLQSVLVGFRDIKNAFTPIAAEGSNFINVKNYSVSFMVGNDNGGTCVYSEMSTIYNFNVDRSCIDNGGYMRFAFKNMLGGYDMVSSRGAFVEKTKNKFQTFEQSLGYDNWNNAMDFGNSNWSNTNVKGFSVTTHNLKPEYAAHFAEMFSSTQVYLRVENDSYKKIYDVDATITALEQPYFYEPIVINAGSQNIIDSSNNTKKLTFSFDMAVNQRNPRY